MVSRTLISNARAGWVFTDLTLHAFAPVKSRLLLGKLRQPHGKSIVAFSFLWG